eukprot:6214226-Pleurochrysis_carterae.AAC.4
MQSLEGRYDEPKVKRQTEPLIACVLPPWKKKRNLDFATMHGVGTTSSHHGGPIQPWARGTAEAVPPKTAARKVPKGEVSITVVPARSPTEVRAQGKPSWPDPSARSAEKKAVDKLPVKSAEKKVGEKQHGKVVEKKAAERTTSRAADKRPAERTCVRAYVNALEKTCSGRGTSSSEIMRMANSTPTAASSDRFGESVPEMSADFFEELRREWFYNSSERSCHPASARAFSARPPSEKPQSVRARSTRAPASVREGASTATENATEQPEAAKHAPRSVRRDKVVQTAEL